jgi:hypothetical protein
MLHRIDNSIWRTYSTAIQSQLLGSFRFLGLVDDSGRPTISLKRLVQDKPNRKAVLREVLESSYGRIVALDLTKVSPKQLDDAMHEYGMTGETHKKVLSFFLRAAKYAELPMSPLLGRKIRAGSRRRKRGSPIDQIPFATALGPTPDGLSSKDSRTIRLRSGGAVTINVQGSLFDMPADDREFVLGLMDKLREYKTDRSSK